MARIPLDGRSLAQGAEYFTYKNGALCAEDVPVSAIAAQIGTPFYVYSAAALRANYRRFAAAFADMPLLIAYAVKANSSQAVLKLLAALGAGADIVSGGELMRALRAGIAAEKIVYSGVGKTAAEIDYALKAKIRCFNAESFAELALLNERAGALGGKAPVCLRINPDIDAGTHDKIATGKAENKFGIPARQAREAYAFAASLPQIEICGLDVHIGSQIETAEPFARCFAFAAKLTAELRAAGFPIRRLDIGGGLGISYRRGQTPITPEAYAALARAAFAGLELEQLITEPGRCVAGNAGALIASVLSFKRGAGKNFLIADAGMNDLIRPALYDAYHEIIPVAEADNAGEKQRADIVGPVCETGDFLARARLMPALKPGALLAVLSCGAYGAVMSGAYNTRPLAAEVMVSGGRFAVIRPRQTLEALLAADKTPDWL